MDVCLVLLGKGLGETKGPTVQQDSPAQGFWLHVNHTVTRYCCRGGSLKIHGFEDQVHTSAHGDDFS